MCGIVGVSNHKEAAKMAFLGLYALQHRGEEAAGIVSYDGKNTHTSKATGLIADAFSEESLRELRGKVAIGHSRYSTTGSSNIKNVQPFIITHKNKPIAVSHNGNLTNTEELYKKLEEEGSIFQTTMDSELFVHLLVKTKNGDLKEWFIKTLAQVQGAFSAVFLVGDILVGVRDSQGFRPLCLGKLEEGSYVLASETCALDLVRAEFVREIEPGEIVFIHEGKIESCFLPSDPQKNKSFCIFENIYFARPDSNIFGDNVYEVRKRLGVQMAIEHPV
ncbi:MAG TPA: class II glutamine amidotransferase, partial [Candidatus Omnitrophota bacterium]|nr:class II glutamine amidotransferase [Candidatus Omnitrophota bacterium]